VISQLDLLPDISETAQCVSVEYVYKKCNACILRYISLPSATHIDTL